MKAQRNPSGPLALFAAIAIGVGAIESPPVLGVECGETLVSDLVLDRDLECEGSALVIGADGITVDLNGHALLSVDGEGLGVDNTGGYDDVTIRGGTIDGFREGVLAKGASGLTLRDLEIPSVSDKGTIPGNFSVVAALHVIESEDVVIEDCSVRVDPIPDRADGVLLQSVDDVRVENVGIEGSFVGVHVTSCGDTCLVPFPDQPPTAGAVVKGCTVERTVWGIIASNAVDATIEGNVIMGTELEGIRIGLCCMPLSNMKLLANEISGSNTGIRVASPSGSFPQFPISDLAIEGNTIHDNVNGMVLVNLKDSQVSGNDFTDNLRYGILLMTQSSGNRIARNTVTGSQELFGIGLAPNTAFPDWPGPQENVIKDNHVRGNSEYDLFHSETATPNTWENNCFDTVEGDDIDEPVCGTRFRRGDANADGELNLSDAHFVFDFLFEGGQEPMCPDAADADDSGVVEITDGIFVLRWLFNGGPEPTAPGPETCGSDGREDELSDCEYAAGEC